MLDFVSVLSTTPMRMYNCVKCIYLCIQVIIVSNFKFYNYSVYFIIFYTFIDRHPTCIDSDHNLATLIDINIIARLIDTVSMAPCPIE